MDSFCNELDNAEQADSNDFEDIKTNPFHQLLLNIPNYDLMHIPPFSITGDNFFHLLGTHCTHLRELYARNLNVSDDGIRGLCVTGNCKSILILDLGGNPVSFEGIKMVVDNLSLLKFLYHESILEDLACIAQIALDQEVPSLPKYSLSTLHLCSPASGAYEIGSLGKLILLCPFVTQYTCTQKALSP
uniref:Uncharacterized protein n=1 Tax=Daphnia galeata TaxID=27404 RepID=A0A8J2WFP3_9CRUS|nr:unnamed protein product [Daphnia galeata]